SLTIPNLSKSANGSDKVDVALTGVTLDSNLPYIHIPKEAAIDIYDVYLKGSSFGLKHLGLSYSPADQIFSGEVTIVLRGGGSVGGSVRIIAGQLDALSIQTTEKQQLFAGPLTASGIPDGIFLTALSGGFDHLHDGQPFTLLAGKLTENGYVDSAGLGLT